MKKFLSLILLVVLVASVLAIATSAGSTTTYWAIDSDCLVKARTLDDGFVPTFKSCEGELDGLLVGLPTDAKYIENDDFFQAKSGYSTDYFNKKGDLIKDGAHIGTTDIIKVYDKSTGDVVAQYGIVTYGDADGDGVFDVLDAYMAALCLNGFIEPADAPAVYEAVKPRESYDNEVVEEGDYQQIVNDVISSEGQIEENKKGRKIPVDDSISFESVIYACDGNAKVAAVNIPDSNFKSIVSIKYNDTTTVPTAPGIYSITAEIPDNTDYLVTPGTRNLGFVVIAPKTGTGYTTIVDNVNKNIIIDINKPNATGADLTGYIKNMVGSAYSLNVASSGVASSTDLLNALALRSYNYYTTASNIITITAKSITSMDDTSNAALGCYLPDDYTLWNNTNAQKTVPVAVNDGDASFGYNIIFRQNSEKVDELDRLLFFTKANAVRGQRSVSPPDSTGVDETMLFFTTNYKEVFVIGQRKKSTESNLVENTLRTVVGAGDKHPTLISSLGGTGLKTALLGDVDTIMFVSSATKAGLPAFSSSSQLLYNDSMKRYSSFGSNDLLANSTEFLKLLNNVLGGLNISVGVTSKTDALIGKTGWCRYACADDATGLRYTSDMYMEFTNVSSDDAHRTLLVEAVDGCTITTEPTQGTACGKMIVNEPFKVTAKLAEGYKLSVKDASGNDVEYDAVNNYYIMPNSNVTVTAVLQ